MLLRMFFVVVFTCVKNANCDIFIRNRPSVFLN